jgi:hypothetical protein
MPIDVLTEAKLDEAYLAFKSWDKEETTKQKQFVDRGPIGVTLQADGMRDADPIPPSPPLT